MILHRSVEEIVNKEQTGEKFHQILTEEKGENFKMDEKNFNDKSNKIKIESNERIEDIFVCGAELHALRLLFLLLSIIFRKRNVW